MNSPKFPLMLDLVGRRVLLVGGGSIAARRARDLLAARANILVVAPQICETLMDFVDSGQVEWEKREYSAGDTVGAWLVQTATGRAEIDSAVAREAETSRIWCVVASDGALSTAWTAAVARGSDGVVVAVSG
ncbi:MAG: uroporphyrinogen-III C-methyltransferase, partial [Actinobacteria bacterium]|nr:uroporphyrinogen-III C-methyltransferase [Actinomycetota bacterium]